MTSALVNNVLAIEIGLEIKYKHICMICRKIFFRFVFVNDVYMSKKVDFTQQSGKNQVILSVYHFICCVVFLCVFLMLLILLRSFGNYLKLIDVK